ncbi:RNA polymerase sigma factor [Amycolatopsis magusensis]|uniref:RNA polymerase sigma-70 factor (ECF subfamily) n=1 Tax=Amycolatopsis magusensis TaxID=882444 RepID=A0ABS4PRQ7_9PSEU|nr:sigma-70 family RNA polymerase sigma factor [Amycolatopsis magusensis]MBP2182116.1 RNA polymerase sigma-70 factor (ECF subfamily) [Amycolatopsis magusensis]
MSSVQAAVARAHRLEWALVLAATVRVTRDLGLAEECVQDAYTAALTEWTRTGVPAKPGAWLTTAARHNALDVLRRSKTLRSKLHLLVEPEEAAEPAQDDRLRLVFLCCHPALAVEAQVALTLRLVCGVSTPAIADAFLVSESTMAARLTRAKKKIAAAGIPFRLPRPGELPDRLDAVLTVIHLAFTAGHTAAAGPSLTDDDLAGRAVDLARLLGALLPKEREVRGLLALLLANAARRASRTGPDGELLRLSEQDRSAWDQDLIAEADRLVVGALRGGRPGRFALQAAIALLHATAPAYEDTDWSQILVLYGELTRVWPSPVVALNRAVALSMADGPAAALTEVEQLEGDDRLSGYHYLPAVKADLLDRLGRPAEAAVAYERALALAGNDAERAFLRARLAGTGRQSPHSARNCPPPVP